jgi:16S rRNA processing protein RimM
MGRILAPHGVWGWVKVRPWSEDPATLLAHAAWFLRAPGTGSEWKEIAVAHARAHASGLVAELRGVGSREAAESLRGFEIGLPRELLDAPRAGEFYWTDLEGMMVVNRAGIELGCVAGVSDNGAHPILRVAGERGAERLIPFVAAYVDCVDATGRRIEVDWQPEY